MANRGTPTQYTDEDGTVRTYMMMEVDFAPTDGKLSGSQWAECARCSWVDRKDAMARVGGRYYCQKNGCAQEKQG